jgi:arylsulfatase A-like enzyme
MQMLLCALALTVSYSSLAAAPPPASPPNIIVVMGDDHAQWAMGAYGLEYIDTPNLDWLAEQGVIFNNAMSPAPVCSSARASFYTGKMPSQHGVHDFLSDEPEFDADWLSGEVFLSERLKKAGYRTALFGKWHATTDSRKPQRGFDKWLSYDSSIAGWRNQYLHSGTVHFSSDGEHTQHTGVQARYLTEEAIQFIDEPSTEPFFISLNFTEPHAPFEGMPERLVARYRNKANMIIRAGGSSDLPIRNAIFAIPEDHTEKLAQYLAAISLIDDQIGRLFDALQGRDLLDNTLLIYTSDHGLLVGQYDLYGKTNATRPSNFYEETIRIPLVIYGPDRLIKPEQSRDELVDLLDLHATVLDYATNGDMADTDYGPGRSVRPLLDGERNTGWRTVQFAERGNARMVTDGRWKLVRYYQQDPAQPPVDRWYDLVHPFGERHDAVAPRPAMRDLLIGEMKTFFSKYETEEHSGRTMWSQPAPNSLTCPDFPVDCQ